MADENTNQELHSRITEAIDKVKADICPKDTGIGKLLKELKDISEDQYKVRAAEYREVFLDYEDRKWEKEEAAAAKKGKTITRPERVVKNGHVIVKEALSDSEREKHVLKVLNSTSAIRGEGDTRNAKERESKIKQPKIKTAKVPKIAKEKGKRDHHVYTFMGETFKKGKLVLAVIKQHVKKNPKINVSQIKAAFPDHLLKGYGIVQEHAKALEVSKDNNRFFLKEEHLVKVQGGTVAVCNQFSVDNIHPFLEHAKKMGYEIEG